jgi:hypothetical protein
MTEPYVDVVAETKARLHSALHPLYLASSSSLVHSQRHIHPHNLPKQAYTAFLTSILTLFNITSNSKSYVFSCCSSIALASSSNIGTSLTSTSSS